MDRPPTPMMQRYLELKAQHPHALLLFRMGDFYELFYEDAQLAAKVLGLTLTSRDKGSTNPVPMAGFPYHALDGYLKKLVHAGVRAAVCEQMEDPKTAKGLVQRDVTRVVTPGTLTDDALLEPNESNFLACVYPAGDVCGLAWLELSSGRFQLCDVPPAQFADELARIQPAECLCPETQPGRQQSPLVTTSGNVAGLGSGMATAESIPFTTRAPWCFNADTCLRLLLEQFGTATLEGFDIDAVTPAVIAAGALLDYVRETQRSSLQHLTSLEPYRRGEVLLIDEATRRSLELTRTLRHGTREGSLLAQIDETVSPMGARLLGEWLSNPLTQLRPLNDRLDAVEELVQEPELRADLTETLKSVYDLQRLNARLATGRATPRDLVSLARTLALVPQLKARLAARRSSRLQTLERRLDLCAEARRSIEQMLVDDPPLTAAEGGVIRAGANAQLDEWRDLARGGKEWIARYQAEEIERTGIANLKVGFNRVFGYYLETTSANADRVPPDYIRKQTLKNQERFITPPLKDYEEKVLRAEGQAISLEQQLFESLRQQVATASARFRTNADVLAELDVLCGLATLAVRAHYVRPELTEEPILRIRAGRHPTLDRLMPAGQFVPNDIVLGADAGTLQLITGPNMAGKSTYIRQAALLCVLAQIGSFVPAAEATIGLADRIFARVGASDELGRGQSTFMVEMTEAARILNSATARSVIILDEIGRGTSTYDGLSLAWSIAEFLHDGVGARTFFATHYHELTRLEDSLKDLRNFNVAVRENDDEVIFLHRIVAGAANKSYGIHVARLAGIPQTVLQRARIVLKTLESDEADETGRVGLPPRPTRRSAHKQLLLFEAPEHPVVDELRKVRPHDLSPEAALEVLKRLHSRV